VSVECEVQSVEKKRFEDFKNEETGSGWKTWENGSDARLEV